METTLKEQQINHSYKHNTTISKKLKPVPKGLPKTVESICPECKEIISAKLYEEDGKVMMSKTCSKHGYFKDLYWSDVNIYLKAEKYTFRDGDGHLNPRNKNTSHCPKHCGLCDMHASHSACGNIDLTNRCNQRCPICFANANVQGYVYEPSYEQIVDMMMAYVNEKPVRGVVVQFAGGEPTIHPRFLDIIKKAKELEFSQVQIATNGKTLASLEFAQKCKQAGLDTIYLQFDGVTDDIYQKTRGESLLHIKLKALENIRKTGFMKVILVPTIVKGLNDHQIGDILKFAIDNTDIIGGISYQPVCFTGRISTQERLEKRFTLPDLAKCVEEQTGLAEAQKDWFSPAILAPFSRLTSSLWGRGVVALTCHAHCGLGTYLFIDKDKNATSITKFLDIQNMFKEMDELADKTHSAKVKSFAKMKAFNLVRKYFNAKKAPKGLTVTKFLQTLDGLMNKKMGRGENDGTYTFRTLMVAGMHFMDGYNYEIERVKRCLVHYSTPAGIYPFCTYNSGPVYREKVEKQFSIPLEEYRRLQVAGYKLQDKPKT